MIDAMWWHKPWWRHEMKTCSTLLALCVGIHRWPVNSPHKGQWRGALMFSLICAWINGCVNIRGAGDLRRHRTLYNVTVMPVPDPMQAYQGGPMRFYWIYRIHQLVVCDWKLHIKILRDTWIHLWYPYILSLIMCGMLWQVHVILEFTLVLF